MDHQDLMLTDRAATHGTVHCQEARQYPSRLSDPHHSNVVGRLFAEGVVEVEEEIGWATGTVDEHHSTTVETVTLEVDLRKVAGDASGMSENEEIGILMQICAPEILVMSETGPWICSVRS